MKSPHVVIVARPGRRQRLGTALVPIGCDTTYATVEAAVPSVAQRHPDVVLIDASQADCPQEIDCLRRVRAASPQSKLVFVASVGSEDLAVAAFDAGAHRYVREPWTPPMLQSAVAALVTPVSATAPTLESLQGGGRLVGRSQPIRQLRSQLARIAPVCSNVLILGETGTGKELVAELIHLNGNRALGPFICLNTAAIPDALLENELFGHERGAFTGATAAEGGKLTAANGGTIFFDEVGDISLPTQAKILRAIESKTVYRLGSSRAVQVDVRVVAATNSDLDRAIREGRFREDLYYRLNVIRVELPPLRKRVEDIPLLVAHYLHRFNQELGRSVQALSARAMDALCAYPWPGNVRELRSVMEALLVNLAPGTAGTVDVPPEVMRRLAVAVAAPHSERERLLSALISTNWNKSRAAEQLSWSRMTLYRKMAKYHMAPGAAAAALGASDDN